jgi:hypothetical protein
MEWGVRVSSAHQGQQVVEFGKDRAAAERACVEMPHGKNVRYELVNRRVSAGAWWGTYAQPHGDVQAAERDAAP